MAQLCAPFTFGVPAVCAMAIAKVPVVLACRSMKLPARPSPKNEFSDVVPVQPGDTVNVGSISGQAVPAYNTAEERLDYHPKSNKWVGYVLSLDGRDHYHAGDTDHVPELDGVKAAVAFVPIGGTYTMEADEAAGLVKSIGPELAVPMHFGFVVGSSAEPRRGVGVKGRWTRLVGSDCGGGVRHSCAPHFVIAFTVQ